MKSFGFKPLFNMTLLWSSIILGPQMIVAGSASANDTTHPTILLTLTGKLSKANLNGQFQFDRKMLESLGLMTIKTSTPWTEGVATFQGVLVRDILAAVGARGQTIYATAINDYGAKIPITDVKKYNVILALKMNGKYMSVREKGPLWLIYPWDNTPHLKEPIYYERSIWQLNKMVVK